jgi:hypothetical protein
MHRSTRYQITSCVSIALGVLAVLGCGGSSGHDERAASTSVELVQVHSTDAFFFEVPSRWFEMPERAPELEGDLASAAAVAPEGSAPSSVVAVLAYDVGDLEDDTAAGRKAWFELYADTHDAAVTRAPREIAFDEGVAIAGSLRWPDSSGNLVDVDFVRAVRAGVMYLIQCQAAPVDRAAIAAGCNSIVKSFRSRP